LQSVEVWQNDEIVGGLYGIDLGHMFCGESMFFKVSNAKVAFIALSATFAKENYKLLDCQVYEHLESLGCREIAREDFMSILENEVVPNPAVCCKSSFKTFF
jgi:leucyl/phenylalanyl-tRNA--protein transferase